MISEIRRYLVQTFIGWAISANPNETESDRLLTVGLMATLLRANIGPDLLTNQ